ncbi:MAG: hypothetical protein AB8D52_02215 [Gammaproteobacteria bacterium]
MIHLKLQLPYVLDEKSLPAAGRLSEWLKLETPIVNFEMLEDSPQYSIKLVYQIVNVKPDLKDIPVSSHILTYKNSISDENSDASDEKFNILIPTTRIGISTLTDRSNNNLEADVQPSLLQTDNSRLMLFLLLFLSSFVGLAYLKWGMPLLSKNHPFANAYKALNNKRHIKWNDVRHRQALEEIHKAFNQTAKRTVFIEKLDNFFDENKKFTPLRSSIENYFTYSRKYFFEGLTDQENDEYTLPDLINFLEQCRDIERGIV